MEDAPKNEVIPQENTNTEARPQQSRFAALLKSHPCTDYIYIYIYIYICIYSISVYISKAAAIRRLISYCTPADHFVDGGSFKLSI